MGCNKKNCIKMLKHLLHFNLMRVQIYINVEYLWLRSRRIWDIINFFIFLLNIWLVFHEWRNWLKIGAKETVLYIRLRNTTEILTKNKNKIKNKPKKGLKGKGLEVCSRIETFRGEGRRYVRLKNDNKKQLSINLLLTQMYEKTNSKEPEEE